ncbi:AAA family ATPase [Calditerricola satsumensis]
MKKAIRRVVIENFQSHERSELEFSPGLNVIVGPSDSGKSAIVRALRWALFNQPRGSDFVRAGADSCRVTVCFDDGTVIVRERTAARNRYRVRTPDGREQVFEGFGTGVPDAVLEAHGLRPLVLDEDLETLVHLAMQLDPPFLLGERAAVRAKVLGLLSGAHIIDAAIRDTQRDVQALGQAIRHHEQEIERLRAELKPYDVLPAYRAALTRSEAAGAQAEARLERLARLQAAREAWRAVEAEQAQWQAVLARLSALPAAERALDRLEALALRLREWRRLAQKLAEGERSLAACRAVLARTARVPAAEEALAALAQRTERLSRLRALRARWGELARQEAHAARVREATQAVEALAAQAEAVAQRAERHRRLVDARTRLREVTERLAQGEAFLREQDATLRRLMARLRAVLAAMKTCPLCGSPVDEDRIAHILDEWGGDAGEPGGERQRHGL